MKYILIHYCTVEQRMISKVEEVVTRGTHWTVKTDKNKPTMSGQEMKYILIHYCTIEKGMISEVEKVVIRGTHWTVETDSTK